MVKGIYGTVNGVGGNFGNSRRGGVKTKSAVKSGGVVISDFTVKPWGDGQLGHRCYRCYRYCCIQLIAVDCLMLYVLLYLI